MTFIVFDAAKISALDMEKIPSWIDGTIRYMLEIVSELAPKKLQGCSYKTAEGSKEDLIIFKNSSGFSSEKKNWFFPSINCAFPNKLKEYTDLNFFVTIYDVIPLLYPELWNDSFNFEFRNKLQSYVDEERMNFFCISENSKQDFCKFTGIDTTRVVVTPLAANNKTFYVCQNREEELRVRRKYSIDNSSYFFCFSSFSGRKNQILLLQAIKLFFKKFPNSDVKLVLAGSGVNDSGLKDLEACKEFILREDLEKRIHLLGFVEEKDLPPLMSNCLSFLYPSLYEGFGLQVLEAMQCGAPVIASDTSSIPEVVGDAGISLPPDNAELWAQAMERVYESKELQKELSGKSLERASLFSWKKTVSKMLEAFELNQEVSL
jgi:glycosyltransferase involved in cell wall biosynthesis